MFGLKDCKEEDFFEFNNSNSKYAPKDADEKLIFALIFSGIFMGIAYVMMSFANIECPKILKILTCFFAIADLFFITLSRIKKKEFAFKLQKVMMLIIAFNWFVFSISGYPMFLVIAYNDGMKKGLFQLALYLMAAGIIYLIFIMLRLVFLIKKGEMRKGCLGLYDRLFNGRLGYVGVSVPIIVIVSKCARRITIDLNGTGADTGLLLVMLAAALIIQLGICTMIPECIILFYCRSRFKSFNYSYELYSASGKKLKQLNKQAQREYFAQFEDKKENTEVTSKKKKKKKK